MPHSLRNTFRNTHLALSPRARAYEDVLASVVLNAKFYDFPPILTALTIGVTQRLDAAAVLLLVELLALADLDHALGAALLAPVEVPVHEIGVARRGAAAAVVDLVHVLPARDAERAGHDGEAVLVGVERSALEAHVEAHGAAPALLRLVFHPLRAREPVVGVVVRIHERHAELLREADVLALAQLVFLLRVHVRVVEEDRVVDARGE